MFEPVRWELVSPRQGASAQDVINMDLVATCDLLIGVFWTRLGTPTGRERSGTVEEIRRFAHDDRPAGLFFKTANMPMDHDPEQYRSLREFQAEVKDANSEFRGLAVQFRSLSELDAAIGRFLTDTLRRLEGSAAAAAVEAASAVADREDAPPVEEDLDDDPGLLEVLPIFMASTSEIWTRLTALDDVAGIFSHGPVRVDTVDSSTSSADTLEAAGDVFTRTATWFNTASAELEAHAPAMREAWARLRTWDMLFGQLLPTRTPDDQQRARVLLATVPGPQDQFTTMAAQLQTMRADLEIYRGGSAELNRAVKRIDRALADTVETVEEGRAVAGHLGQVLDDRLRRENEGKG